MLYRSQQYNSIIRISNPLDELSPKQYRALVTLAAGGSNQEAATIAGVSVRSIETWKKKPNFQQQLREATSKVFDQAIAELVLGAQDAAKQLRAIIVDEEISERTRLSAIAILLSNAAKARDWSIEERLERVELVLDGNSQEPDRED